MIAAQPTWGVDVGASAQIRQALVDLRDEGVAVLVISEELDELFEICDRLCVIARGRLSPRDLRARRCGGNRVVDGRVVHRRAGCGTGLASSTASPMRIRLEARPEPSRSWPGFSPFLAATATLVVGFVLFSGLGKNPFAAFYVFFAKPIDSLYGVGELLVKASPLMLCAIGLAAGYRANVWNIGAEGQLTLGAICGGGVALAVPDGAGAWYCHSCSSPVRLAEWPGRQSPPGSGHASTPTKYW